MKFNNHRDLIVASGVGFALALSGCAGAASSAGGAAQSEGFEYGASQEDVNSVIEDLEPVELVFQAAGQSPSGDFATPAYVEAVKERSNGKITIEPLYGQPIAGFAEINDALIDGRIDLSYQVPSYFPSEFPAYDALTSANVVLTPGPVTRTLANSGTFMEAAWGSEKLLQDYETKGLVPLVAAEMVRPYFLICTEPATTPDEVSGMQVRVGSTASGTVASGLGATPISLEYQETYEALQRNTVNCEMGHPSNAFNAGYYEVAPHVSYPTEGALPSVAGAYLGGSNFAALPLAYQQILFDSTQVIHGGAFHSVLDHASQAAELTVASGGSIEPFDDDLAKLMAGVRNEMTSGVESSGAIEPEIVQGLGDSLSRWVTRVEELGYEDHGGFADMNEWYDLEQSDFDAIGKEYFEQTALDHRPQ